MSKEVEKEYTELEVTELVQTIVDEYKVDPDDVNIDIAYEVSGRFAIDNADPTLEDVIEESIKDSISQQSGVPIAGIIVDYI